MTTICLARHGETDWNQTKKLQGIKDIPLNENGRQQAQLLGTFLRKGVWDVIVTSPLSRAKETAHIIADRMGGRLVRELAEFSERDCGALSGLTKEEGKVRYPDGAIPGWEDDKTLRARAMRGLESLVSDHAEHRIVVVSHGALINAILAELSQDAIGTGKTLLHNTCLSMIHHKSGRFEIEFYNKTDHLHVDVGGELA